MNLWDRWVRQPHSFWCRKVLFQVHLWTGIGLGLIPPTLFVTGVIMWWHRVPSPARQDEQRRQTLAARRSVVSG